jgi:hypothetical protein
VAAIGVGLAILEWSALVVLVAFTMLVVLAGLVLTMQVSAEDWSGPSKDHWRRIVQRSAAVAATLVAVWATVTLSPPLGLFLVLAATLSSPPVVGRVRRTLRAGHTGRSASQPTPPQRWPAALDLRGPADSSTTDLADASTAMAALDDRQLCRLWRDSFWDLTAPTNPRALLCVVALREACLDELERRDAAALKAWLDSGARASGGPEKFLKSPGSSEAA